MHDLVAGACPSPVLGQLGLVHGWANVVPPARFPLQTLVRETTVRKVVAGFIAWRQSTPVVSPASPGRTDAGWCVLVTDLMSVTNSAVGSTE